MTLFHNHHIWPQHAIGPAPKNNILRCNVAMHAFMHKLQYEQWGRWEDEVAWKALSAQITKDEAIQHVLSESGKRGGQFSKGRIPWNKNKTYTKDQRKNMKSWNKGTKQSEETKRKISLTKTGQTYSTEHKINISKALTGRKLTEMHIENIRSSKMN